MVMPSLFSEREVVAMTEQRVNGRRRLTVGEAITHLPDRLKIETWDANAELIIEALDLCFDNTPSKPKPKPESEPTKEELMMKQVLDCWGPYMGKDDLFTWFNSVRRVP